MVAKTSLSFSPSQYSMLHVTPPQGPPDVLAAAKELVDQVLVF